MTHDSDLAGTGEAEIVHVVSMADGMAQKSKGRSLHPNDTSIDMANLFPHSQSWLKDLDARFVPLNAIHPHVQLHH